MSPFAEPTQRTVQVVNARFVTIELAAAMTGFSETQNLREASGVARVADSPFLRQVA